MLAKELHVELLEYVNVNIIIKKQFKDKNIFLMSCIFNNKINNVTNNVIK
jgi:hypothetical protein